MHIDGSEKLHDFDPGTGPVERSFLRAAVVRDRTQLRIPSRVDWIELAVMYLANKAESLGACEHDRHGKLVTALTEAVTNAIVHGNLEIPSALKESVDGAFARTLAERSMDPHYASRLIDVDMEYDGQRCRWSITDQGRGFDVEKVLRRLDGDDPGADPDSPDFDPASLLASGRGIMLMRAFLDDVQWSMGGRRVTLAIEKESPDERRATQRHHTAEPIRAVPLDAEGRVDWDAAFDALATNVSAGGIGLLMQGLKGGGVKRIVLEMRVDGKTVYVPAEVAHVEPVGDAGDASEGGHPGLVQIGCRFAVGEEASTKRVDAAKAEQQGRAVDELLDRLAHAQAPKPHDERRAHPRVVYTKAIRVAVEGADDRPAVARDLSKSGIAFVSEFALAKGARFHVILEPDTDAAVRLQAQVMRCNRMAGAFHDIGCRFVD